MGDFIKNNLKSWLVRQPWVWAIAGGVILFFSLILLLTMAGAGSSSADNDTSDMYSSSGGTSDDQWEQLIRYIGNMEGGKETYKNSKGEECYKVIFDAAAGNPGIVGLDFVAGGYGSYFSGLGYDISVGALIPVDVVNVKKAETIKEGIYKEVEGYCTGLNLTQYQLFALTSRAFNHGSYGAINTAYTSESFIDAYKNYWNQSRDDKFKKSNQADLTHKLYSRAMNGSTKSNGVYYSGLERRRESEFRLFQCGWYHTDTSWCAAAMDEQFIEYIPSSGDAAGILASAEKIHKYMEDNNYTYSLDTSRLASTFEASKQYKVSCCATYVSWVLRDAGLIDTCVHHCGTESGIGPVLRATGKFKELDITSLSQLQPGDVMWYPNQHTEIYAGNGTIYNAGSTDAIQRANPYSSSRTPSKAFRCIATSSSGGGSSQSANISKGGYDSIYKSSITGKTFKEFKQNSPSYSYPSIPSNCSWRSECGTVSTIIIGSGYNSNVTMKTGADLLWSTGGSTSIPGYISTTTKKSTTSSSTSVSTVRSYLQKGYVGVIHNPGYSGNGHFVAILDISSDGNKVYISNPDIYGASGGANGATKQGWNNISTVCNAIDNVVWVGK